MKRKKWVILGIGLAGFGLYAVMTGGLAVSSISDFGGQRDIRFVGGLKSDVWLAPRSTSFGVPFLFHYYGAGRPFGLRIQIWDDSKQYRSIEITEVVLEYQDGDVVRKNDGWSRQLKPYTQYNSSSSGIIQTEMFMLSDQIERLVLRHADVRVTLKGHLVKTDGERIAFEVSESFKAESRSGVTTFWEVLAGC
ncbi:MAG: hypothetical protein JNM56_28325 [Planctomycetia bacterium]|nr:hypothetical protein [Planctomycetia bacterium]